jgi:hypothetical protein
MRLRIEASIQLSMNSLTRKRQHVALLKQNDLQWNGNVCCKDLSTTMNIMQ